MDNTPHEPDVWRRCEVCDTPLEIWALSENICAACWRLKREQLQADMDSFLLETGLMEMWYLHRMKRKT
jgi:hypothetical protein